MKQLATCAKPGTIEAEEHLNRNEVPLIEFVPPSRIKAEEITDKDVPKLHRFPSGPRLLRLELCLPGVDYHYSKYATPRFVHGHQRWFQCGGRSSTFNRGAVTRKLFALENCNATDKFSGYPSSQPKKWTKASRLQQPRNGELWYRASASRLQVSVALEYRPDRDDSSESSLTSSTSTSTTETLSLLSAYWPVTSQTKSSKCRTQVDCPHYYYWDSGLLAHKIDVERSQLVTEKNRIIFYLTLSVFRKKRRLWTEEELAALTKSLGYVNLPRAPIEIERFEEEDRSVRAIPSSDAERDHDSFDGQMSMDHTVPAIFQVTPDRKPGESLGLTLVERPLNAASECQDSQYSCSRGIFIKQLASGGLAERSGQLKVHDQLLAINSVSVLPPNTMDTQTNQSEREADSLYSAQFTDNCSGNLNGIAVVRTQSVSGQSSMKMTMMYPFAVRLLRQAIGPIHLTVQRMVPVGYQPATEPESTLVESEHVASICDELTLEQLEPQNTLPIEQVASKATPEPILSTSINEIMPQSSSDEQSTASTRRPFSPIEVSQTTKLQSTILIEENESKSEKSQFYADSDKEHHSATSQCLSAGDRLDSRTDTFETTDRPPNSSLQSTGDTKVSRHHRTRNQSTKSSNLSKHSRSRKHIESMTTNYPQTRNLNRTRAASPREITQDTRTAPDSRVKHRSHTERVKRPNNPVPQLLLPTGSPKCRVNSARSQTSYLQSPSPNWPNVEPPSSGDQRLSNHMRKRQHSTEKNSARRKCKAEDQRSRRHGCPVKHETLRCKSANRLDSRLATLAKHITEVNESNQAVYTQPNMIDADESRSFRELIAGLNESEWQALLQMVSQPDESYQTPLSRSRTKRISEHDTKQKRLEPKPRYYDQYRSEFEPDRGDGRSRAIHHHHDLHTRRRHN